MPRYGTVGFIHGQMSQSACPRESLGLGLMWWNLTLWGYLSPESPLGFAQAASSAEKKHLNLLFTPPVLVFLNVEVTSHLLKLTTLQSATLPSAYQVLTLPQS
jgi:hypothetical protein